MNELKYLNKYFLKYRYRIILGILITVGSKIFALFTPQLIGKSITLISNQITNPSSTEIFRYEISLNILYIFGAAIATGIFTFLMRQTIINVSRYVEFDLKNEIYNHYQQLSIAFYKRNRTGDLMSRISEDVSKVRMYIGPAVMYTINTLTLFVVALFYMYDQSPTLTLYTILPLPFLSVSIYFLSKLIHKQSTIVQSHLSKLSSSTQEFFSGIWITKAYALETQTEETFSELANSQREKRLGLSKIQALFFPLMLLLIGASNLLVIYIGGKQYMNGQIEEIGIIAEFIIYVNMLTWPVASIGWVTSLVQEAEASQKRINEFLKETPSIVNPTEKETSIDGDIVFKDVHFTYEDTNIEALKGISFEVEKGKTLAIIGNTGSGKSTILELIGRLYDVQKGAVEIDGANIKTLNLNSLRTAIGFVPQDPFLFSDSLKNNIKFGKNNATEAEVIEAAKKAVVHKNIINFKNGYETILGERGITLSGGQKQRVSIARAFIKSPQILLLDDCLSAVDTETEEQILNNIELVTKNKTTIIVSHRISSAKNADTIIVLNDGIIAQQGTHDSLISVEGYYKELYQKQLRETSN
ncbi:ABC transporter ATP-binding protein/permease [Flavobacteriaceae bacterium]|nr:ABC transporter ATP-binding protein/permease [Flavobacteriaceae bacterium]MDB9954444.1 ABC transporter ATP-binding protein/permease [Flavobacteriaceae bacterium]